MSSLKKPYLKKFSIVANFTVWIVDGEYVRDFIDEEFTNYGHHYRFKFIPKNEFWIDNERVPGEEKYYIDSMLVTNRLMSKGISHEEAVKKADAIEKSERSKSELMKKEMKLTKDREKLINSLHKKFLKTYSTDKIKVWVVNGELVRDLFFIDFTEGGHDIVYHFMPENEIWLDDDLSPKERKFVLLHEACERNLMLKGKDYNSAHMAASSKEHYCRMHPKETDKCLREEFED